ncbi:MAG: family 10 glycosylhydrolase [Candidatus Gastranaerophilaceae bacterium]|nr:family 10 glycosylhydrolase [Candidatus Gastranaerophilaceae bacterium]
MKLKNIIAVAIMIVMGINMAVSAEEDVSMSEIPQLERGEILFSQSRRLVNAVNPTPYSNPAGRAFPGARGANQLILYTSEYGEHTGTNEFGTEAIIEGNTVVELSGADSVIPQNGAVLSGHGDAKNWISSNLSVGTKIYYDDINGVITTYTTSKSFMFEANQKIDEANEMIDYYRTSNPGYDWKIPMDFIKDAQNYMRKGEKNPNQMQKYSKLAIESANYAIKSVLPFRTNEFKGVWLRPAELSPEEISESVKKIKAAGIDNIFIETYFHGRTIFPSKTMDDYGFISQNEKFVGFDPLKVWISEAHKNGMKVHIWFESFYVGNMAPSSHSKNILAVKPAWGNKTLAAYALSGATPSVSEHNGYFLDPANPEVQEFLEKLLEEIITTYKPDGINLDYIRYPQAISSSPSGNWGYTEYARNAFNEMYGVDPVSLKQSDELWYTWGKFRRQNITDFVARISKLTRKNEIYLSAVIFPDKSVAYSRKMQDWSNWSQNHYINGFTPLFLTCDSKTLSSQVTTVQSYKEPETDLFAGLFVTFMGGSEEDLIRQIHETRKLNVNGVILFDYAHLDDKYVKALSARVFASNGKSSLKKNSIGENTFQINNESPIELSKNQNLQKVQNSRLIIHRYDPDNVRILKNQAPSPLLQTQKRKY